ncbi:Uncharacterised protein [uncultured archaeon]|nr:Uncharacterised protein [uncultured archaeon]
METPGLQLVAANNARKKILRELGGMRIGGRDAEAKQLETHLESAKALLESGLFGNAAKELDSAANYADGPEEKIRIYRMAARAEFASSAPRSKSEAIMRLHDAARFETLTAEEILNAGGLHKTHGEKVRDCAVEWVKYRMGKEIAERAAVLADGINRN